MDIEQNRMSKMSQTQINCSSILHLGHASSLFKSRSRSSTCTQAAPAWRKIPPPAPCLSASTIYHYHTLDNPQKPPAPINKRHCNQKATALDITAATSNPRYRNPRRTIIQIWQRHNLMLEWHGELVIPLQKILDGFDWYIIASQFFCVLVMGAWRLVCKHKLRLILL